MDYTLQSDPEHRILLVTLGKIVTQELASAASAAVQEFIAARNPCSYSVIADLSAIVKVNASAKFIRSVAAGLPAVPPGNMCIIVAPRDETFGLSRMFQILRDDRGARLEVVHTLEEAFEILGLDSPHFRTLALASGGRGY
jgi:hypothetical protein